MRINKITASKDAVIVSVDTPVSDTAVLEVYLPLFRVNPAPLIRMPLADFSGMTEISLPRTVEGYDGLCLRYVLYADGKTNCPAGGPCFVEEIGDSGRQYPYPTVNTKKGLQISDAEDAKILGVKHSAININQGDMLIEVPEPGNTLEYTLDGKTYYFRKSHVERMDARLKNMTDAGVLITLILLNCCHWEAPVSESFWNIIRHPDYSNDSESLISAFNLTTPEGYGYYRAFVSFIADRYTREDGAYGKIYGMIIGNEVNSGYVWCNAGQKDVRTYSLEYLYAVRVAWQTAASVYANIRIYLSFDHFWCDANFGNNQPLKYYGTRPMLEILNDKCRSEGQVPWNIAFHPYPQDLNFPDFWNDTDATPDDDCSIITFRNLEVLARFTYREEFLYRGERRRIILSEQGFNSHWTPESEVLQACAYGHAYRKVMSIPEIDSFILHAHRDNVHEFGLNLGLWRRKKDSGEMDAPKPIYYVFKAIDQKDEKGVYHWERY